jgi:hypothetical protein
LPSGQRYLLLQTAGRRALLAVFLTLMVGAVMQPKWPGDGQSGQLDARATKPAASVPTRPLATGTAVAPPVPTAVPTRLPAVEHVEPRLESQPNVLLLTQLDSVRNSDANLRRIVEYYGLIYAEFDLASSRLTDATLHRPNGAYYKAIVVNAFTLEERGLLDANQIALLRTAVDKGGSNLFVSEVADDSSQGSHANLKLLTSNQIFGATRSIVSRKEWAISNLFPEITRVFSGQTLPSPAKSQWHSWLRIPQEAGGVAVLIEAADENGKTYPVLARFQSGLGGVFLDSTLQDFNLENTSLSSIYGVPHFPGIVPTMMVLRYALGEGSWHSDHYYANLTIDDPALTEPFGDLSFVGLLDQMRAHNFHTTIAFVPANLRKSQPGVVTLFKENPDRLSVVQHGNNHAGYEFYRYATRSDDPLPARPFAGQDADIKEGLERMEQFSQTTGLPFGRVMIFPEGIAPEDTLALLKKYNYNVTVNGSGLPLNALPSPEYDAGVYQAISNYGGFPALKRNGVNTEDYLFNFFVGKPALMYTHQEFFRGNMGAFSPVADVINQAGQVEWRSLDYIADHLYLEKMNDDGSVDVKACGNHFIVSNETAGKQVFHIAKEESLNVPIMRVMVNGNELLYRVRDGNLLLDIGVPAHSIAEVVITYDSNAVVTPTSRPSESVLPMPSDAVVTPTILADFEYLDSPVNHGWKIIAGSGESKTVYDESIRSRVLVLDTLDGLGFSANFGPVREAKRFMSARLKTTRSFALYVRIEASDGKMHTLVYTSGLGPTYVAEDGNEARYFSKDLRTDGQWYTFTRDLQADLYELLGVRPRYVTGLVVRGSVSMDDITLK